MDFPFQTIHFGGTTILGNLHIFVATSKKSLQSTMSRTPAQVVRNVCQCLPTKHHLVGGIPTHLKNDGVRQLGWWHSQSTESHIKTPCSSHHQPVIQAFSLAEKNGYLLGTPKENQSLVKPWWRPVFLWERRSSQEKITQLWRGLGGWKSPFLIH